MAHPPSLNVANVDVAHPIPGGTRITTDSPSEALPRPSTLAGQSLPPPHKYPYLLEGFDLRGEPLAKYGPTAAHPTYSGGGETYATPDQAPMRRESLRRAPHPHTFPPRVEPLARFRPTAAHSTHPGGGMIYSPTGRAPERWEASKMQTHQHDYPPRGEPLAKFWTAAAHPTHPGGGEIYPPTGRAPERQGSLRMPPPTRTIPPLGSSPWKNLGRSPRTPPPIWGDPW